MSDPENFTAVEGGATIDKPIRGLIKNNDDSRIKELDTLKTFNYAKALAEHVKECGTPLTVGVQGEWGSGKTSLLNMMREQIEETEHKRGKKGPALGKEIFKTIWINTWEHSLLKTPEECLLSIINEIIDEISGVDGTWDSAQKAKSALSTLARGAVRVGATAALGAKGGQVADEMFGENSNNSNSVKVLRTTLETTIAAVVERPDQDYKKFIIFIDDLDRLDPSTAVMVLELLKNIFDLPNCVFVVAIDYQVVVKGLKDKFGEQTEENEWEFRAFFDKIIQLPFMMPMNNYKLDDYLENLLEGVGYFKKSETKSLGYFQRLTRMTIGHNPRSLKRLVNSLSLINKYFEENRGDIAEQDTNVLKQLILIFVCIQISFPKIFELLRARPAFYEWDDEFVNKITGGPHTEDRDLATSLSRAMEVNSEDFDSEWEQSLFKIVWVKKWQREKLVQASRVLSIVEEKVLTRTSSSISDDAKDNKDKSMMNWALDFTAVTSVASTEDSALLTNSQEDRADAGGDTGRLAYWRMFRLKVEEKDTLLSWATVRATHTSASLNRYDVEFCDDRVSVSTSCRSTAAVSIDTRGEPMDDFKWFSWLKENHKKYFDQINSSPHFKISQEATRQTVRFSPPSEIVAPRKDISSKEHESIMVDYLDWVVETLPKVEIAIQRAFEDFNSIVPEPDTPQVMEPVEVRQESPVEPSM